MYSAWKPMRSAMRAENMSNTPGATTNMSLCSTVFSDGLSVMRSSSRGQCIAAQAAIEAQQRRRSRRCQHHEQQRERRNGPGVAGLHGLHQHVADAALRREHLADQRAEQRQREADAEPGHDLDRKSTRLN